MLGYGGKVRLAIAGHVIFSCRRLAKWSAHASLFTSPDLGLLYPSFLLFPQPPIFG